MFSEVRKYGLSPISGPRFPDASSNFMILTANPMSLALTRLLAITALLASTLQAGDEFSIYATYAVN